MYDGRPAELECDAHVQGTLFVVVESARKGAFLEAVGYGCDVDEMPPGYWVVELDEKSFAKIA